MVAIAFIIIICGLLVGGGVAWIAYKQQNPSPVTVKIDPPSIPPPATEIIIPGPTPTEEGSVVQVINLYDDEKLSQLYLGTLKTFKHKIKIALCYKRLLQLMKSEFPEMKMYQSSAGDEYSEAQEVWQIKHTAEGETIDALIILPHYTRSFVRDGNKPLFNGVGFDASAWLEPDGTITFINAGSARFILPTKICDGACRTELKTKIEGLCKEAELERLQELETIANSTDVYMLEKSAQTLVFSKTPVLMRDVPPMTTNLSYEKPIFRVGGVPHKLPMAEMMNVLVEILRDGNNFLLLGGSNVGKSTLAYSTLQKLKSEKKAEIITLNYTTLKLLKDEGFAPLNALLRKLKEEGIEQVVYLIDEGQALTKTDEHTIASVLQLMNGENQSAIMKSSVIMAINAEYNQLPAALTGPSRTAAILELSPLEESTALALADHVRKDPDITFDMARMKSLINSETPLSPTGKITLGEVFGCAEKTSFVKKFTKMFSGYRLNTPTPPAANPKK